VGSNHPSVRSSRHGLPENCPFLGLRNAIISCILDTFHDNLKPIQIWCILGYINENTKRLHPQVLLSFERIAKLVLRRSRGGGGGGGGGGDYIDPRGYASVFDIYDSSPNNLK
jgi:hypothetical protein